MRYVTTVMLGIIAAAAGCVRKPPPDPWYQDSVEYFPPGPEFKLSRVPAAQKALAAEQEQQAAAEADVDAR